jgi:SAM-dependent methyltransferase
VRGNALNNLSIRNAGAAQPGVSCRAARCILDGLGNGNVQSYSITRTPKVGSVRLAVEGYDTAPKMILKLVQKSVRRIRRGFSARETGGAPGTELPASWYDSVFKRAQHYHQPFYLSAYYPTWTVIADRLQRYGARRILDVGCGPGQFAQLLYDWGFEHYIGIDFSSQAIEISRKLVPEYEFRIADARSPASYEGVEYDAIVCTEVLEHVEDDFAVISCFRSGAPCLCTVPNFPYKSHVRHFASAEEVTARYRQFFNALTVTRLKGTRDPDEQFFLMDGQRNSYTPRTDCSK